MQKEGRSSGSAVKWILIGCGTVVILGVLLVGTLSYFGYRAIKQRVETRPQEAERAARAIMEFEIPGGSKGLFAMNAFGFKMAAVQSWKEPPDVVLILGSLPASWGSGEAEKSIDRKLREVAPNRENIVVEKMFTRQDRLCQQTVNVIVKEGWLEGNGRKIPMSTLQTLVKEKTQIVFAIVQATGQHHHTLSEKVFRSLRCKL